MLPLIEYGNSDLVKTVVSKSLSMIKYDDYPGHKEIFREKINISKIEFKYTIIPDCKEVIRNYNLDVIYSKVIRELVDVYSSGICIYTKDGNILPDSSRRQIEKNGKIIYLPLTNPNDEVIHPYFNSNLFFLSRRERKYLSNSTESSSENNCLYLNVGFKHYGHFLYESISRLWALPHISTKKIIVNTKPVQWVVDLLKPFGIYAEDILFGHDKIVHMRKLTISSQLTTTARFIAPEVLELYDKIKKFYYKPISLPLKIYLSRKKIKKRSLINESDVEKIFCKYGFTIIYPEELSVQEQINYMCKANYVAGPKGTALHNIFYRGNDNPLNLLMLDAKVVTSGNPDNYFLNFAALNANVSVVYGNNAADGSWSIDLKMLEKAIRLFLD